MLPNGSKCFQAHLSRDEKGEQTGKVYHGLETVRIAEWPRMEIERGKKKEDRKAAPTDASLTK